MSANNYVNYYNNLDLKYPEMGIVLEDNYWNYGESKTKAKINIPVLLPLKDKDESSYVTSLNISSNIANSNSLYESSNYMELYLPDSIYTYPTEQDITNPNVSIKGAKSTDSRLSETNKSTINGLTRVVKKGTRVIVVFIGGNPLPEYTKIIAKYDDYEDEKLLNGGNTGGIDKLTIESAIR